jgi:hypothetical protein
MPLFSKHNAPQRPTNQKFGWFFTAIFAFAAGYAYLKLPGVWLYVLLGCSLVTAIVTAVAPRLLTPFNKLWFGLGILLGKIVSPIVLGVIFFGLLTPIAIITRLFGRDVLSMKKRQVSSYWVDRQPVGPQPESFKNQF